MTRNKPISPSEFKILVYNKTKRGMDYRKAVAEVQKEIETMRENSKKNPVEKPETNFKEEFEKLRNGKKRKMEL